MHPIRRALAAACTAVASTALAQVDPLDLQSAPTPPETPVGSPLRLFIEAGVGHIAQRFPGDQTAGRRLSIDLRHTARVAEELRFSFSNRLDHVRPAPFGRGETVNSMREAFLAWQPEGSSNALDFGRINLRQGAAYGYNPTDYFRTNALRTVTTADPVTLRQIRLGAVMARGSWLWANGGATVALSPKLRSAPNHGSLSLDIGSTNSLNRALLSVQTRGGPSFSVEGSVFAEQGSAPSVGVSATALLSDSIVAYGDLSSGKKRSLHDQILNLPGARKRAQQAAAGLTYTLPSRLAVTVELEHNSVGLDGGEWAAVLGAGPAAYQRYVELTRPSQELGSRNAWLVYVNQKGLGLKQLDMTAFVRINTADRSRLGWVEMRYHWPQFDAVLQWQRASGSATSEFGTLPYRQLVQLLGVMYF